jgi:enoyl-CoA hydratase/carnithine racemase
MSLPEYETIELRREDRVTWLVLNRPESLNAMNATMMRELGAALAWLGDDDGTHVIAIRGAGRAFSAGYDIKPAPGSSIEHDTRRDSTDSQAHLAANIDRFMQIWDLPKPVVAAVHGYCLAGATQLCCFCDLTIVADDAHIGLPSLPVGGGYISPIWTPFVGPKRAKQLSFVAGSHISGAVAAQWGWANYAVPAAALWDDVSQQCREIAKMPARVLRLKKLAINRAFEIDTSFRTVVGLGADVDALLQHGEDVQAYRAAIREHGLQEAIRRYREDDGT